MSCPPIRPSGTSQPCMTQSAVEGGGGDLEESVSEIRCGVRVTVDVTGRKAGGVLRSTASFCHSWGGGDFHRKNACGRGL